jgi:signal transduction histidine kinase
MSVTVGGPGRFGVPVRLPEHEAETPYQHRAAAPVTPEAGWPRLDASHVGRATTANADAVRMLVAAHEEERQRISRDLHDTVGQALTAIRLHLELIRRDPTRSGSVDLEAAEAIGQVDAALGQVRDLAFEIRPTILDDLGLVAAARSLVMRQARIAGLAAELHADMAGPEPGPAVATACYRTLQEAVTNVSRHASASRLDVTLVDVGTELILTVRDDGVGIDRSGGPDGHAGRMGRSLGLRGIRERITLVGGSLAIESEPGQGTRLRATFPLVDGAVSGDLAS